MEVRIYFSLCRQAAIIHLLRELCFCCLTCTNVALIKVKIFLLFFFPPQNLFSNCSINLCLVSQIIIDKFAKRRKTCFYFPKVDIASINCLICQSSVIGEKENQHSIKHCLHAALLCASPGWISCEHIDINHTDSLEEHFSFFHLSFLII